MIMLLSREVPSQWNEQRRRSKEDRANSGRMGMSKVTAMRQLPYLYLCISSMPVSLPVNKVAFVGASTQQQ